MKKFLFACLMLLSFSSCLKKVEQASDFTAASFPINLGNWWRYQRTNALTNEVDTIEFHILGGALVGTEKKYDCETQSCPPHLLTHLFADTATNFPD